MNRRLMSVEETANYLDLSEGYLRNRTHRKSANPFPVAPIRIGSRVLFDKVAIDAWVDSLNSKV